MLMRRSRTKRTIAVLAALLLIAVMALPASVMAAEEGAGVIRVRGRASDGEMIPDYTVALYKVADYSGAAMTFTADFADCGLTHNEIAEGQDAEDNAMKLTAFWGKPFKNSTELLSSILIWL